MLLKRYCFHGHCNAAGVNRRPSLLQVLAETRSEDNAKPRPPRPKGLGFDGCGVRIGFWFGPRWLDSDIWKFRNGKNTEKF